MITDPAAAAPRADLSFLRHRARPRPAAAAAGGSGGSASAAGGSAAGGVAAGGAAAGGQRSDAEVRSAIADFVNGRSTRPGRAGRAAATPITPAPAAGSSSAVRSPAPASGGGAISFDRPGRSHGVPPVTRSRPAASAPTAPRSPTISFERPAASSSLDLDSSSSQGPSAPPSGGSSAGGSLDLSGGPAAAAPRRPSRPRHRVPAGMSVRAGQQQLFTINDPTLVLTLVQSGVGLLGIEAVCGPDVGDLRLGAAYQLRSGPTSTVQLARNGNRFAPTSRRPVIVAGRDEYEHLGVDLRQVTDLERMAVYAFSESGAELTWGGTLIVTTFGGGRVELPLEALHPGRIAMLISIYNVDGRLVVRAEMETIAGDVREAARAYGYDRITWRDASTPVD